MPRRAGITAYDGRETAPAGATPTMFLDPDGKPLPFRRRCASGLSVGVPGAVALLELAHKEHGKLPWADLFAASIEAAREGLPVSPRLAALARHDEGFRDDPAARAIYLQCRRQRRRRRASAIVNPALADTMQRIASDGARVLREGPIAEEMVARVHGNQRPGTLALADLADYKPIKREPVCGPYRVWIVCGMPPPSSGGIAMLQMLELLEPFESGQGRAQRPALGASDRRGEPARLRRPRALRRRPGLRAGADRQAASRRPTSPSAAS